MCNYKAPHTLGQMTDGTSGTMIVGEVIEAHSNLCYNVWSRADRHENTMRSTENPLNTKPGTGVTTSPYGTPLYGGFGSNHTGGGNFAFADGHVTFISNNIALTVYQALSTRNGNESVEVPGS
jgi:prepilin-type processing-associated H-X9-DG protein